MKKIAIILADGFEEVEAISSIDFCRRADLDVYTAGLEELAVEGAHGVTLLADMVLDELPGDLDGILLPGGTLGAENLAANKDVILLIKKMAAEGKLVSALCASPAVVLGSAGLLEGKKYTCYPGLEIKVSGGHFSENRVVLDGNILTSRSIGTAEEFALAVVDYLAGKEMGDKLRKSGLTR